MNPSTNSTNIPSDSIVKNEGTSGQTEKIFGESNLSKNTEQLNAKLIQTQIKNLLILMSGAADGCDISKNLVKAVRMQIKHTVDTTLCAGANKGDSTIIVYDFIDYILPTKEGVPVKENDQPEKWTDLRVINFADLIAFDNATGCFEGDDLMDAYAQWYGKGKGAYPCNNKVDSVVTEQVEDDVEFIEDEYICRKWSDLTEEEKYDGVADEDDDETAEDAMLRECQEMIRSLTFATPFVSLELDIAFGNKLFAEWDWMREQKSEGAVSELLEDISKYMAGFKLTDNLMDVRMEMAQVFLAYECMQLSKDEVESVCSESEQDEDDSEDDTPQNFNVPRKHNAKLTNTWYYGMADIEGGNALAELEAALAKQREHEALLAF